MTAMFVLIFLSNALVDPATLPGALQRSSSSIRPRTSSRRSAGCSAAPPRPRTSCSSSVRRFVLVAVFAPLTARLYGRT
jgi:hypothetical protein